MSSYISSYSESVRKVVLFSCEVSLNKPYVDLAPERSVVWVCMKVFFVFELVRRVHLNAQRSGESAFALNKCGKPLCGDNLGVFYAND